MRYEDTDPATRTEPRPVDDQVVDEPVDETVDESRVDSLDGPVDDRPGEDPVYGETGTADTVPGFVPVDPDSTTAMEDERERERSADDAMADDGAVATDDDVRLTDDEARLTEDARLGDDIPADDAAADEVPAAAEDWAAPDESPAVHESPAVDDSSAIDEDRSDEGPPAELMPGDVPAASITALWSTDTADGFRSRWRDVQLHFVDDPRAAATEAQTLVTEVIDALSAAVARQKDDLDGWASGEGGDTEELRMAVRRYRDFLDRILGM